MDEICGAIVTSTLVLVVFGHGRLLYRVSQCGYRNVELGLQLQVAPQACSYPCQCPAQPLQCPAGTSLLLDGCGCCKVCARQLGELCSLQKPCDHHKGLYCDFSKIHRDSGICLARQGATCDLLGKVYLNGESFQPSCKLQCVCLDGAIGCIPLCSDGVRLPSPDCPFPRRVKVLHKCCEEWVCEGGSQKSHYGKGLAGERHPSGVGEGLGGKLGGQGGVRMRAEPEGHMPWAMLGVAQPYSPPSTDAVALKCILQGAQLQRSPLGKRTLPSKGLLLPCTPGSRSRSDVLLSGSVYRDSPAHKPQPKPKPANLRENCLVQTTQWSACSKTCGMGISTRVTNDNSQCRLEKESRLCLVRHCESPWEERIKSGKKCLRNRKPHRSVRFEFTGCTSARSYRPKFCGSCVDGRCCTPHRTHTAEVQFRCPEGDTFVRKMMMIRSCSCHRDCPADNDIFLATYRRRMIGDHVKPERQ
ncbi:hypothetical protein lerEdw1_009455 [Lerista edwardsae]|nr:hypothetical protein lerEdw1_009455 [Lerista edwardsae]